MHPDWTLRVPLLRPRLAAWLDGAAMGAALAAPLLVLHWQAVFSLPALAAWAALAVLGAAYARRRAGRSRSRASALRMDRDGAFHLRLRHGWHPVEWVAAWRGPRWLTLRARLPGAPDVGAARHRYVTVTVWQDALPAPAWRRTCLLANRRLCRTAARPLAGTPVEAS